MANEQSSFDVSWRTIARILIAAALVWVWLQLWQFAMVIVIAIIIAVALDPAVRWLERRRIPRGAGAFIVVLLLTTVGVAMIAASWVTIREQSQLIVQQVTERANQIRTSIPLVEKVMPAAGEGGADGLGRYALGLARSASSAVGMIVLSLVLTIYLLIEWKRTLDWLIAFVPERYRPKTRRTLEEARDIVYRYAVGNVIASIITGVITFGVLTALTVPAALVLALVSGVLNFIPIIGFIISSVLGACGRYGVDERPDSGDCLLSGIQRRGELFHHPEDLRLPARDVESGGPDCRPRRRSAWRRDGRAPRAPRRRPLSNHRAHLAAQATEPGYRRKT